MPALRVLRDGLAVVAAAVAVAAAAGERVVAAVAAAVAAAAVASAAEAQVLLRLGQVRAQSRDSRRNFLRAY